MAENKLANNKSIFNKIHKLEVLALILDNGCKSGKIANDDIKKVQNSFDNIANNIFDNEELIDTKKYLFYEVQALLFWVNGDESEAVDMLNIAIDLSKHKILFTKSANEILGVEISDSNLNNLHKLEDMALMLDAVCQSGKINNDEIYKFQNCLNKIAKCLDNIDDSPDYIIYLIYENQALINWIYNDETEAYNLVKSAIDVKGDGDLYTKTAKELIGIIAVQSNFEKIQKRKYNLTKLFKKLPLIVFCLILLLSIFWPQIDDYLVIQAGEPYMKELALKANMSTKGKAEFLRTHPELVSNTDIQSLCNIDTNEDSIEQGCYVSKDNKIYIREMPTEFKSAEVVTAAHELLHVVYYKKLKSDDITKLNDIIESNYKLKENEELINRMAMYAIIEPEERESELFSILGTEYNSNLSDLSEYYSPYFNDNLNSVVAENNNTKEVLKSNENKLSAIMSEITNYKNLASQALESANYAYYCSTTWARAGNSYENDRNYNIYLKYFNIYKDYINKENSKVEECNTLLEKNNTLIAQFNGTKPIDKIQKIQAETEK